jgi:hypothetical protein
MNIFYTYTWKYKLNTINNEFQQDTLSCKWCPQDVKDKHKLNRI